MSALILPSRRITQPQGQAEIDWANPFAKGLARLVDRHGRDLVAAKSLTRSGTLTDKATTKGVGKSNGGTGTYTATDVNFVAPTNTAFSIVGTLALNSTGQTNKYVAYARDNAGSGNQIAVIYGYVANSLELYTPGFFGSDPRTGSQIVISDTNTHTFGYSYDGVTWTGCLDGAVVFSTARSFNVNMNTTTDIVASLGGISGGMPDVTLLQWATYSRGVGLDALRKLTANPNQLYKPQTRRIWVDSVAAAGGASTITAADGTSTTGTLAGQSTASAATTAAAGVTTASSITGTATAASVPTSAPGVSTASTLTGSTVTLTSATITAASGLTTASTITASSTAAAVATAAASTSTAGSLAGVGLTAGASGITSAAGTSTSSTLTGNSTASSTITSAAGVSTAGALAGSAALNIAAGSMVPASGTTSASVFAASAVAASVAIAAAGASSAAVMASNGTPLVAVPAIDAFEVPVGSYAFTAPAGEYTFTVPADNHSF